MQIVCPHCTTSYAVDSANFSDAGRRVRCARCQQVWLARPELVAAMAGHGPGHDYPDAREDRSSRGAWHEGDAPHVESPSNSSDWPDPRLAAQAGDETDARWPAAARLDEAADEGTRAQSRFRSLGRPIIAFRFPSKWLAALPAVNLKTACVAMGAMVFALIAWRAEVVRLMPQTATFFKMAGMGVNLRGLAFEDVKITTETVNNKPVLLIEGAIIDVTRKSVEIPRLRFIVRDAQGSDIYAWNAVLEQPALNPGEKAWFKTRLAAPPAEGREIAVRYFHKLDIATGGT